MGGPLVERWRRLGRWWCPLPPQTTLEARIKVAQTTTAAAVLVRLSEDWYSGVARAVASNDSTPVTALVRLGGDSFYRLREPVSESQNCRSRAAGTSQRRSRLLGAVGCGQEPLDVGGGAGTSQRRPLPTRYAAA